MHLHIDQVVMAVTVIHDNDDMYHPCQVYTGCLQLPFSLHRLKINIIYFYIDTSNNNNVINTCTYTAYEQAVIGMIAHNPIIPLSFMGILFLTEAHFLRYTTRT